MLANDIEYSKKQTDNSIDKTSWKFYSKQL